MTSPKPLTAPLAQIALANTRPAPPSSRPIRIVPPTALQPDRQHVDKPEGATEVAGKKRKRSPESIEKMKKTLAAKRAAAAAAAAAGPPSGRPKLDGLDLVLDIIELVERAKNGLSKSQRARLRAALNERLS